MSIPAEAIAEVKRLLQQRKKIAAIKAYREATGLGLKEAKEAVEEIEGSSFKTRDITPEIEEVKGGCFGLILFLAFGLIVSTILLSHS